MSMWETVTRVLAGQRRATIDAARSAPPPSPLAPIDYDNDQAVHTVLTLASEIGDVLLGCGIGNSDTVAYMRSVAASFGIRTVHIDITLNTITIAATRGDDKTPVHVFRVVNHLAMDFDRLTQVDKLIRRIRGGGIDANAALQAVRTITHSPAPYPAWAQTLAWAGMAGAVAALLGGSWFIIIEAFLITTVIMTVNGRLAAAGLPLFFQQMAGGFIGTLPAILVFRQAITLGVDIQPSQMIASSIVVLLAGLQLVASIQDAITGAPVTASARFFEVVMLTGGIISGVASAIQVAALMGFTLPPIQTAIPPSFVDVALRIVTGALAAMFFAMANNARGYSIPLSFFVGMIGALFAQALFQVGIGTVLGTGVAAMVVGLLGGLMARRFGVPPLIVAVSGITPFLPGLAVYRGLYALLNEQMLVGFGNMALALGIASALAAGVVLGEWVARKLRRPRVLHTIDEISRPVVRRVRRWGGPGATRRPAP